MARISNGEPVFSACLLAQNKVPSFCFAAFLDTHCQCAPRPLDAWFLNPRCSARLQASVLTLHLGTHGLDLVPTFSLLPMSLFSHPAKGPVEPVNMW